MILQNESAPADDRRLDATTSADGCPNSGASVQGAAGTRVNVNRDCRTAQVRCVELSRK